MRRPPAWVLVPLALLSVGALQGALTAWSPGLGRIDGLMIAAGLLALRLPFRGAVLAGAAAGLLQDAMAGGLFGLHAFSKTATIAALAAAGTVFLVRGPLAEGTLVGIATAAEAVLVKLLLLFLSWPGSDPLGPMLGRGLFTGATCALLLAGGPRLVALYRSRRGRARARLRFR